MGKKPNEEQDNVQLEMIRELIHTVQFGTISIIIQDGRTVQIDKNEE